MESDKREITVKKAQQESAAESSLVALFGGLQSTHVTLGRGQICLAADRAQYWTPVAEAKMQVSELKYVLHDN